MMSAPPFPPSLLHSRGEWGEALLKNWGDKPTTPLQVVKKGEIRWVSKLAVSGGENDGNPFLRRTDG